jgi:type IV secretory pathway VirB10-like protein
VIVASRRLRHHRKGVRRDSRDSTIDLRRRIALVFRGPPRKTSRVRSARRRPSPPRRRRSGGAPPPPPPSRRSPRRTERSPRRRPRTAKTRGRPRAATRTSRWRKDSPRADWRPRPRRAAAPRPEAPRLSSPPPPVSKASSFSGRNAVRSARRGRGCPGDCGVIACARQKSRRPQTRTRQTPNRTRR